MKNSVWIEARYRVWVLFPVQAWFLLSAKLRVIVRTVVKTVWH